MTSENGPNPEAVYAEKGTAKSIIEAVRGPAGRPDVVRLSTDKQLLTASARAVLENAEGWAHRVGGSDIGVRHLVASYVLNPPPVHRAQMQRWGFQESKWRSAFFEWVARQYTAEQWIDASRRPAPTKAVPAYEKQQFKASSIAFPGDSKVQAVLEKAATYHARRPNDPWLRLQTVFYSLVETARDDLDLREAILPVWDAISSVEPQYQSARDTFFTLPAPPGAPSAFSGLDISPRVLNALETARALAVATGADHDGEFRVTVLDLAGALISRRVDDDEELAKLGLNPQMLRVALIDFARQGGQSPDIWRESLGEEETVRAGRPVDLNSDDPEAVVRLDATWTSDTLSIRRDVEAFAALLASRSLEPPLSIGLFGPWGSGKTTFLKRLRQAVDDRAHEAKDAKGAGQPTAYVSNVVHVSFNAWHFAEDALTSSLVDTILRALTSYIKDDKSIVGKEWVKQKLDTLVSTKRKLEAAEALEASARRTVEKAQSELANARREAAERITGLQETLGRVWNTTKNALKTSSVVEDSGILNSLGDTIKSTEGLQARLNTLRARPAPLLSDLGWGRSIIFAVAVLALPPIIGWVAGRVLGTQQTGQLLASVTAMISVIGVWARAATAAASKVDAAITQVADEYAKQLAADPQVTSAQADVDAAHTASMTAAAGLLAAREELARARTDAANATVPAQMLKLASSRIQDQSYNKELTTLSLARADLEALSVLLRDERSEGTPSDYAASSPAGAQSVARAVDRVILYIDDLDRCNPRDVVRVLQLVHMLLAFELFVVVVAVDARWVEEALTQSYPWLESSDPITHNGDGPLADVHQGRGRVTPQDYLEKIFQISFWLEPMNTARAALYLASLVRPSARDAGPVMGSGFTATRPEGNATAALVVGKVEIEAIELDYMRALSAYLGPSPRRVKRLVNSYRLIKARLPDSQLSAFLTDKSKEDGGVRSGPYQTVISLLVIGTGAPSNSARILKELGGCDPKDRLDQVVERLRARNLPDWTMAAQVIETLMRAQNANDVSDLRGWAPKVSRFLLNGQESELRGNRLSASLPKPEAQVVE